MGEQILGMASSTQMDSSYLMEKKFEFMIESSNKKLVNEISTLKSTVSSLNIEIASLRKQIEDIQKAPVTSVFEGNNAARPEEVRQVPVRSNASPEIAKGRGEPLKPRFGDYTPEDVPVEKFFYFGNKGKR